MVVYSLHSEAEWNQLCAIVHEVPLTSDDVVRIDASFSVGTIGGVPGTPLTIGPATLNGSADGSINVLTFVCDKTVTGPFILSGGSIRNLACINRGDSSNLWTLDELIAEGGSGGLLKSGSYGTVDGCYITLLDGFANAGIIRTMAAGTSLTIQNTHVDCQATATSAEKTSAFVYQVVATATLTMTNCSVIFNAMANNDNSFSLLPYVLYGNLITTGTSYSDGVRGQVSTVGTAYMIGAISSPSATVNWVSLKTTNVTTVQQISSGSFTSATNTTMSGSTVTAPSPAVSQYVDGAGLLASSPTSGHTWYGLGLNLASQTIITITTVNDWSALVTATASTPLTSGQTICLAGNLTVVASPGVLNIGAGNFDGRGYTLTLWYQGSTHTPLVTLAGGVVTNMYIVNQFLSSSGTAVVATNGSYGTFSYLRVTGNCLKASIVTSGVATKTTLVTACDFTGNVIDNFTGGIIGTTSSTAPGAFGNGVTETEAVGPVFTCSNCTATVRFFTASNYQQGGIAFCVAGPASGSTTITSLISGCRVNVLSATDTAFLGAITSKMSGGIIEKCYATCSLSGQYFIAYIQPKYTPTPILIRNCYYINSTTSGQGSRFLYYADSSYVACDVTISNSYFFTSNSSIHKFLDTISLGAGTLQLTKCFKYSNVGNYNQKIGSTSIPTNAGNIATSILGSGGAAAIS